MYMPSPILTVCSILMFRRATKMCLSSITSVSRRNRWTWTEPCCWTWCSKKKRASLKRLWLLVIVVKRRLLSSVLLRPFNLVNCSLVLHVHYLTTWQVSWVVWLVSNVQVNQVMTTPTSGFAESLLSRVATILWFWLMVWHATWTMLTCRKSSLSLC